MTAATMQELDDSRRALVEKQFISWTMRAFRLHNASERDNLVSVTVEIDGKKRVVGIEYDEDWVNNYKVHADPDYELKSPSF